MTTHEKTTAPCTFTIDLTALRFTAFDAPEAIFGIDSERILTDLADFSRLPLEKYCHAVGSYFSPACDAGLPFAAFTALQAGQPYTYYARMRNAATRQFTPCKVSVTPTPDGSAAKGIITPEE